MTPWATSSPEPLRQALPRAGPGDPLLRALSGRRSRRRPRCRRRHLPGRLAPARGGADRPARAALALRRRPPGDRQSAPVDATRTRLAERLRRACGPRSPPTPLRRTWPRSSRPGRARRGEPRTAPARLLGGALAGRGRTGAGDLGARRAQPPASGPAAVAGVARRARGGGEVRIEARPGGSAMKRQEIEATLAAAYPVDRERIERGRHRVAGRRAARRRRRAWRARRPPPPAGRRRRTGRAVALRLASAGPRGRRRGPGGGGRPVVLLAGGGDERPSSAYGAELVRFAESSPLLLGRSPKWGISQRRAFEGDSATSTSPKSLRTPSRRSAGDAVRDQAPRNSPRGDRARLAVHGTDLARRQPVQDPLPRRPAQRLPLQPLHGTRWSGWKCRDAASRPRSRRSG